MIERKGRQESACSIEDFRIDRKVEQRHQCVEFVGGQHGDVSKRGVGQNLLGSIDGRIPNERTDRHSPNSCSLGDQGFVVGGQAKAEFVRGPGVRRRHAT